MVKRIALLDIDPSKYYLMRRNVHGLGNTLWPCKVLCKETHGWMRGYVHLSNDGRLAWLLPLGAKHEIEIRVINEKGNLFVDEIVENNDADYIHIREQQLLSQIADLNRTLNVLQSIDIGDVAWAAQKSKV